jgi:hypothetical protein
VVQVPLLTVVVLSAATLVGLQPNGPGFLGVFPAVSAAALRFGTRLGSAVAAIAVAALAVAWALRGHHPVVGVVLNEFGSPPSSCSPLSLAGTGRPTSGRAS